MSTVTGVVEKVSLKPIEKQGKDFGKNMFSIKVAGDDRWFSTYTNDPRVQQGQTITFEPKPNGNYWNVDVKTIIREAQSNAPSSNNNSGSTPSAVVPAVNKGTSSAGSYNKTQSAIQFQASRNAAIEALKLAVSAGVEIKLPAKGPERLEAMLSLIDEVTDRYFKATTEASEQPGE
jgi:hypothetical protein